LAPNAEIPRGYDREARQPDARRVDAPVQHRPVATVHEVLVQLVGGGVDERDRDRRRRVPEPQRTPPQPPQQPELHHVGELAQHRVERAEPGVEVRLCRQEEDQRHQRERRGEAGDGGAHRRHGGTHGGRQAARWGGPTI